MKTKLFGRFGNLDTIKDFYEGKNVLVTGHTGFKGSWLSIWLDFLGAKVSGLSLDPKTDKDIFVLSELNEKIIDFRGDIRNQKFVSKVFDQVNPEIVFHLAAQPLVSESYLNPLETYEINVNGTINVLESFRNSKSTKVGIFVTTDKVYLNQEKKDGYVETDSLGGYDPYSSSKAAAEIAIESWRSSYMNPEYFSQHGKSVSSVRAGNVIGGGDWAKDRLIPDFIRSIEGSHELKIRNLEAVRPWQHVLDPLFGYLLLGKKMWENPVEFCSAWNLGPSNLDYKAVKNVIKDCYSYLSIVSSKNTETSPKFHETNLLLLNSNKAYNELGWTNKLDYKNIIKFTMDWYSRYKTEDTYYLTIEQIAKFMELIK
jgi:CDP-glucose 4,6-dehydratase